MRVLNSLLLITALILISANSSAVDMKVKPGKWEFVSTTTMAMMGAPRSHTSTQCLSESGVSPKTLMKDMTQGCELLDSNTTKNSMSWKVKCQQEGGEMTGEGQVSSTGSSLEGGMNMKMSFNGQAMDMSVEWTGKHIGACE